MPRPSEIYLPLRRDLVTGNVWGGSVDRKCLGLMNLLERYECRSSAWFSNILNARVHEQERRRVKRENSKCSSPPREGLRALAEKARLDTYTLTTLIKTRRTKHYFRKIRDT